jgi:CDP-glycerol glycerophosphotransferase (TagB/SpsB family)
MRRFDAVVSHSGPPGGRVLRGTALIMVQYGYAKEPYNFGDWRKQAQAICAYGDYAASRFAPHAPAFTIGNPRWDDWSAPGFAEVARTALPDLAPDRPVLLYAPTWGDLSSLPYWLPEISKLAETHTVLVKAHHNAVRDGQLGDIGNHPHIYDISHFDLMQALAVCDILLSDYSGAIFDAIMCDKPVVLLDLPDIDARFGKKLDAESLEMAQRDELGFRVKRPAALPDAVQQALKEGPQVSDALRDTLFFKPPSVAEAFRQALPKMVEG